MARRNPAEVLTGAVVLLIAAGFLAYAVANSGRSSSSGYPLLARFDHVDGLATGADVRIGGVKVGTVTGETLDPATFQAVVAISLSDSIKLPTDSSAEVTSDGLLGGKYLSIGPGGASKNLEPGGTITITQGSVSLEQLLGKFIFSVTDMVNAVKPGSNTPGGAPGSAPGKTPGATSGGAPGGGSAAGKGP